jgi:putative phage-type endonuclease
MAQPEAEIIAARSYVQGSPEWLFARQGRMTASLAAAALGLSPWVSPQSCYRQIVGLEEPAVNWLMEHGREFEDVAARAYAARHNELPMRTGLWIHPEHTWLAASPDRLVGTVGLLEVKCGKTPYTDLPASWWCQAQVQLICTGRAWCDVTHYIDYLRHTWRVVPEDHDLLIIQLREFMQRFVIPQVQPRRGEVPRRQKRPTATHP